jgi:hypothetical protein
MNIRSALFNMDDYIIERVEKDFNNVNKKRREVDYKSSVKKQKTIQEKFFNLEINQFNVNKTESKMLGTLFCMPVLKYNGKKHMYNYCIFDKNDLKESKINQVDLGENFHEIIFNANKGDSFKLFFNYRGKFGCFIKGNTKICRFFEKSGEVSKKTFFQNYKQLHVPSVLHSEEVAQNKISQIRHYCTGYELLDFNAVDIELGTVKQVQYSMKELTHFCQLIGDEDYCFNEFLKSRNQPIIKKVDKLKIIDLLSISHDLNKPSTFFIGTNEGYVCYTSNYKSINTDFYFIDSEGFFTEPIQFFKKHKHKCDNYMNALNTYCHDINLTDFYRIIMDTFSVSMDEIVSAHTYKQKPEKNSSFNAMKTVLNYFYLRDGLPMKIRKVGNRSRVGLITKIRDLTNNQKIKCDSLNILDYLNIAKINIYREKVSDLLESNDTLYKKDTFTIEEEKRDYVPKIIEIKDFRKEFHQEFNQYLKGKTNSRGRKKLVKEVEELTCNGFDEEKEKRLIRIISRFDEPLPRQPIKILKLNSFEEFITPKKTIKVRHIPSKLKEELVFYHRNKYESIYLNDDCEVDDFVITDLGLDYFYEGEKRHISFKKTEKLIQQKARLNNRQDKRGEKFKKTKDRLNKARMSRNDNEIVLDHKVTLEETINKINTINNVTNKTKGKVKLKDLRMNLNKECTNLSRQERSVFMNDYNIFDIYKRNNRLCTGLLKPTFQEKRKWFDHDQLMRLNLKKKRHDAELEEIFKSNHDMLIRRLNTDLLNHFKDKRLVEELKIKKYNAIKVISKFLIGYSFNKNLKKLLRNCRLRIIRREEVKINLAMLILKKFFKRKALNIRLRKHLKLLSFEFKQQQAKRETKLSFQKLSERTPEFRSKLRIVKKLVDKVYSMIDDLAHEHIRIVRDACIIQKAKNLSEEELDLIISIYN